jgi:hypothetical protein
LVVEDSTTPDATAFVINQHGKVGIGVAPDATAALKVDTNGIMFGDGTVQYTAAVAPPTPDYSANKAVADMITVSMGSVSVDQNNNYTATGFPTWLTEFGRTGNFSQVTINNSVSVTYNSSPATLTWTENSQGPQYVYFNGVSASFPCFAIS